MKYIVRAMSVDTLTGETTGPPRDEVIDTTTNELFFGATGRWEVEDRYAAFWNRLNPSWEALGLPREKVVILSVLEA